MSKYEFSFEESFQLVVNGSLYDIYLTGTHVKHEAWGGGHYIGGNGYDTEFNIVDICDFLGDKVTEKHEDYKDIVNDIYNMDFEPEYFEEERYE